jgi:hypothetical protein
MLQRGGRNAPKFVTLREHVSKRGARRRLDCGPTGSSQMSALGHKQKCAVQLRMSALGHKRTSPGLKMVLNLTSHALKR